MIIRRQQFATFEHQRAMSFTRKMTEHLRCNFAADLERDDVAPAALPGTVEGALDDARSLYGISSEDHLELYLECMAMLGPGFDRNDRGAKEILTRRAADPDERMSELNEYLIFGLVEAR
jgi:hypothetical protein